MDSVLLRDWSLSEWFHVCKGSNHGGIILCNASGQVSRGIVQLPSLSCLVGSKFKVLITDLNIAVPESLCWFASLWFYLRYVFPSKIIRTADPRGFFSGKMLSSSELASVFKIFVHISPRHMGPRCPRMFCHESVVIYFLCRIRTLRRTMYSEIPSYINWEKSEKKIEFNKSICFRICKI